MYAAYRYCPDGLRYSQVTGGVTHIHLWDGQNIVAEVGANEQVNARYLRGINLIVRELDGKNQYYLFNAHGDVVQRADGRGNVLKAYRYDAFGNEQNPEKLDSNPFRYCGEYFDKETSTYYLRARNYDPHTGRFTSEDSVRSTFYKLPNEQEVTDSHSLNLYTYGSNNPVLYVDNSGNFAVLTVTAIVLGIGMIADIASGSAYARYNAMAQDANWYTVGNWATAGSFDMVKGAIAPEKPLSAQHWIDSLGTATLVYSGYKGVQNIKANVSSYGTPMPEAAWDSWNNYKKVTVNGRTYAKVGDTLYSRHAIDRMQPSGLRYNSYGKPRGSAIYQTGGDYGRSVAPRYVDYVIDSSRPVYQKTTGNFLYRSGNIQVVTNKYGAVVTVEYLKNS